jgi:AhpC/TSA family
MKWLAALALGTILHPAIAVRDLDGVTREPLKVAPGHVEAMFFVTNDCPVSNYYAHEIRRICESYAQRGVSCSLIYTDPAFTDEQAKKHAADYGHGDYPKIVDRTHALVKATGVAINPTSVLIRPGGSIAYRGRIDNSFAAIGVQRRVVTEHDVRDALDAVLAGRPIAKPEQPSIGCFIEP